MSGRTKSKLNNIPFQSRVWLLIVCAGLLCACASKRNQFDIFWKGLSNDLEIKRITPSMKVRMGEMEDAGCIEKEIVKSPEISRTIALFPGGGQFYNGEPLKGMYYLATSILILPYIVSFKDAAQTVEYLNFKHTLEFCEEKMRVARERQKALKILDPMSRKLKAKTSPVQAY